MLGTIRRDAPIRFSLPRKTWSESFTPDAAITLFNQLEFKSLAHRVKGLMEPKGEEKSRDKNVETGKYTEEVDLAPDPKALRETALGLWVLDSDKTTPGLEEIFDRTGERDLTNAKSKILKELKHEGLVKVYEEIELPLIPIITHAEEKGVLIDVPYLKKLSLNYHKKLSKAESAIYEAAGEVFNINSPKQLGVVLFDKLALTAKGLKKTEGGARSTRESELEKLKDIHPIIADILLYRELQKLLSTYIDNLPHLVALDGRLHTTLNQAGTTTGRMSSSNPNLQNIPVRGEMGEAIRDAFVAPKDSTLLAFDYSQIEMRVLAALSQDEQLIEVFRTGTDVHTSVASRVFKVLEKDVTREMRRRAKVINFGIVYGMGVNALRDNLG